MTKIKKWLIPENTPIRLRVGDTQGITTRYYEVRTNTELAWFIPSKTVKDIEDSKMISLGYDTEFWVWLDKTTGLIIDIKYVVKLEI